MSNNLGDLQDSGTLYPVTTQKVSGAVNNSTSVTLTASNSGIVVGQVVTGSGIPNADGINAATTVTAINSTSLTLSRPATLVDGTVLNFAGTQNSNIVTDFVWKNLPLQPNDDRATTAAGNYVATGVQTAYITNASSDGKVSTFTTNVAHGLTVGQVVNTGRLGVGGTVASPTAGTEVAASTATPTTGASSVTANTNNNTITITTSANHNILPGQAVFITNTVSSSFTNYTTIYQGVYVAQPGTATTALVLNNGAAITAAALGSTGTAVAMPNITTAGTVTVYHYDVSQAVVLSTPSTTTFTVSNPYGYANGASVTISGATGTLDVIGDTSWSLTSKVQSARLSASSISNTINGNAYSTPVYDGPLVDSAFGGYPAVNTGKYKATAAAVGSKTGSAYIYVTAPNNLADFITIGTTTVSITGFTVAGLNVTGATVVAANTDGFVVAGTNALLGTSVTGQNAIVQVVGWGVANYNVTAAAVDAATNTKYIYTAQNNLQVGDVVTITGLTNSVFNVASQTVAAATATSFTLTSQTASTAGLTVTGQTGKVEYSAALANLDGAYSTGTFGYLVPNTIGRTEASAKDAFLDRGITPTKDTDSTKASKTAQGVWRTAGSSLVQINTSATHGLVAGDTITAASIDATINGDQTVLYVIDASNFICTSNATTAITTASGGTGTVIGKVGTVHASTPAGNTRTTTATALYSLWA
jgi:hypothetical protein